MFFRISHTSVVVQDNTAWRPVHSIIELGSACWFSVQFYSDGDSLEWRISWLDGNSGISLKHFMVNARHSKLLLPSKQRAQRTATKAQSECLVARFVVLNFVDRCTEASFSSFVKSILIVIVREHIIKQIVPVCSLDDFSIATVRVILGFYKTE